jgi:hypothetical protein
MRKNTEWLGLGSVLGAALFFALNLQAAPSIDRYLNNDLFEACMANVGKECQAWAAKGGGGEGPRGLSGDARAELAVGETYILAGTIDIYSDEVYLRIDFSEQPWLASRSRKQNPYYRIDDSTARWNKYHGKSMVIVVTARYEVWKDEGRPMFEIYLEPTEHPVLPGLQKHD